MYRFNSGTYAPDYIVMAKSIGEATQKLKNSLEYQDWHRDGIDYMLDENNQHSTIEELKEDDIVWTSNEV